MDNDGTYFKSTTAVSFSTCNGENAISMTVKYKKTDAVLYGTETVITPGVNTCGNDDLDTEFSYDVMYSVTDQFCTVTYTDYVSTAVYLMHFLHGGKGVAFGQKATMEDYMDCNFKALFRDDVTFVTGNGTQVSIRDLIGQVTSMAQQLSELAAKVTLKTLVSSLRFQGTKSNAWEYTGISFTVPAGYRYITRVYQTYSSGKPLGIGVGTANNLTIPNIATQGDYVTMGTYILTPATYYVYTMRATVPIATNAYDVLAIAVKP